MSPVLKFGEALLAAEVAVEKHHQLRYTFFIFL
jgi:hypothetical protein